jgi:hypothetical protein
MGYEHLLKTLHCLIIIKTIPFLPHENLGEPCVYGAASAHIGRLFLLLSTFQTDYQRSSHTPIWNVSPRKWI